MGYNQSVFIGPYLEVPKEREIQRVRVVRRCPNHPEKKMKDEKFCPLCGNLIENFDENYKEKVHPMRLLRQDFDEYSDDDLWSPEFLDHLIIPNERPPSNLISNRLVDGGDVDLTEASEFLKNDIEWFKKEYGNYINFLKIQFGNSNVNIKWGLVVYWS